jgi:pilus assembly protein TadC
VGPEAAAALLIAAALTTWPRPGALAARRSRPFRAPPPGAAGPARDRTIPPAASAGSVRRRWALAAATGVATGALVGGVVGLVLGAATTAGAVRVLGRGQRDGGDGGIDLPAACDLLAVCLAAGTPVVTALAAVGSAVPDPLGAGLRTVAGLYRLGAEPRRAWADVPPPLVPVGRILVRSGESGAAVAGALAHLAADSRAAARAEAAARVRRAGVWLLAPLGLCFLPAFLCLGVVPLVLGIAGEVFR